MKKYLFINFLFFLWTSSFSQEVFKGEFVFNGLNGYSVFEFKKGANEGIIKDGKFQFSRNYVDSIGNNRVLKNFAEGSFKENNKNGSWIYKNEDHLVSIKDVKDFNVISYLESQESILNARYNSGIPEGYWVFKVNQYSNEELQPKAFADRIIFKNGYITGDFQYKTFEGDRTFFINGKLSNVGEMDGEWTLIYGQDSILVSEIRNYEKGFLLGLVKRDLETGELLDEVVYFSTIEKLNQVKTNRNEGFDISDRKFEVAFNDGFRRRSIEYRGQYSGNDFIESFLRQILQFEQGDYVNEEGGLIKYPIFTRRFRFDLSEDDKIRILEIPKVYQNIRSQTNAYANMNTLALNKYKSDSLAFAHEFFQVSQLKFQNFENLIEIIEEGRIEFYDIKNYIKDGLEYISNADTINYAYKDEPKQKIISFRKVIEKRENFLSDFSEYLAEELEVISGLGRYVERELFVLEQDENIQKIEAEILTKKSHVDSLFTNHEFIDNDEAIFIGKIRQNFLGEVFESFIKEYGNAESFADKVRQSEKVMDLLNELEKQFDQLIRLYPAKEKLDELYQEEFFNPFTYARYNQRVKERLFEHGGIKLFNHYLDQLKEEKDYIKIKDWVSKIEKLHNRMLELRNEDTRKLERKIRNNTPVNKIESLLDL
jgi:hypothetical protein